MSTKKKLEEIQNLSSELEAAINKHSEAVQNNEPVAVLDAITRNIRYFESQLNELNASVKSQVTA